MNYGEYGYNGGGGGGGEQEQNFVINPQQDNIGYQVQDPYQQGQGAFYQAPVTYQQGQVPYYPGQAIYSQQAAYQGQPIYLIPTDYQGQPIYPQQATYYGQAIYPEQAGYLEQAIYPEQAGYLRQAIDPEQAGYPRQETYQDEAIYQEQAINFDQGRALQEQYDKYFYEQRQMYYEQADRFSPFPGPQFEEEEEDNQEWQQFSSPPHRSSSPAPPSPMTIDNRILQLGSDILHLPDQEAIKSILRIDADQLYSRLNVLIDELRKNLQSTITWHLHQHEREQRERRVAPHRIVKLTVNEVLRMPELEPAIQRFSELILISLFVSLAYNGKNLDAVAQSVLLQIEYDNVVLQNKSPSDNSLHVACRVLRRIIPEDSENRDSQEMLIDSFVKALELRAYLSRDLLLLRRFMRIDVPRFAGRISPKCVAQSFALMLGRIEYMVEGKIRAVEQNDSPRNRTYLVEATDLMLKTLFDFIYGIGSERNNIHSRLFAELMRTLVYFINRDGVYRTAQRHISTVWNLDGAIRQLENRTSIREHYQPEAVLVDILRLVSVDDDGNLYARQNITQNSVVFREPVVALSVSSGNLCDQCYAVIGPNFIPCKICASAIFCSDSCAQISRMEMVGKHRNSNSCVRNIRGRKLSRYALALAQLVYAVGGPEAMKEMVFKRTQTDDLPYTVRDWKHVTEDYNIFAIAAIFSSCPKSGIANELTESKNVHNQDFGHNILNVKYLTEAIFLAKALFRETTPRLIECLHNMLCFLRRHPMMHQPLPIWHDPLQHYLTRRAPDQGDQNSYALGAFGAGFIRTFSCDANIRCRLVLESGAIEYVATRPIEQGEVLQLEWPMCFAEPSATPGTWQLEKYLRRKFGRMCWCAPCLDLRRMFPNPTNERDDWLKAVSQVPEHLKATIAKREQVISQLPSDSADMWRDDFTFYSSLMQDAAGNPFCQLDSQPRRQDRQRSRSRNQTQLQPGQPRQLKWDQQEFPDNPVIRNALNANLLSESDNEQKLRQCLAKIMLQKTQQSQQQQQQTQQ